MADLIILCADQANRSDINIMDFRHMADFMQVDVENLPSLQHKSNLHTIFNNGNQVLFV